MSTSEQREDGPSQVAEDIQSATNGTSGEAFDFRSVLQELVQKREPAGIPARELGVLFQDLAVAGLNTSSSYQSTFGSVFDPRTALSAWSRLRHPPVRNILQGFEGLVRPGEMLLVLGSPGSGCSTLLKVLANQRHEYHSVHGEVLYDSFSPADVEAHFRGDVIYSPEDDVHFPTLTVDQTLEFATATRAPHSRASEGTLSPSTLERVFGLLHVKDTIVGDASIRGISGGERKRVSISEALATRPLIASWDKRVLSTRGLDSSTSLEFVQALRAATDTMRLTTIVSLYQAGEPLYEVFDKVCVVYEGRMAYFGPSSKAKQYFIDLGYHPVPPSRQTTPDFLVTVTDPKARVIRPTYELVAPRTAAEFAEGFLRSDIAKQNKEEMRNYRQELSRHPELAAVFKHSVEQERGGYRLTNGVYTVSILEQTSAILRRRVQILKGDYKLQTIQLLLFILQGIIMGTIFYQTPSSTSAYFSRGGVLFFALLFAAISSMAEVPSLFIQKPIVLRQHRAAMYHPFVESVALTIVDLPVQFITMTLFSVVIYFLVGLQTSAGQFFIFLLFVMSMAVVMKTWFRAAATAFTSPAPAVASAGLILLVIVLYTGYAIPRPTMIGALRWLSYINPGTYGFEAIMTNEFRTLNGVCSSLVPSGQGYENVSSANQVCTTVGSQPGRTTVNGDAFLALSYKYAYSHVWRNFGIVAAFFVGFFLVFLFFSEFNTKVAGTTSGLVFKRNTYIPPSEDDRPEVSDEEKGHVIAPATRRSSQTQVEKAAWQEEHDGDLARSKGVFTWNNLSYTVPTTGGEKVLLNKVSGYVVPGKLTALMGESGAGKTTLLNVLAQRVDVGVVTGECLISGLELPADFKGQTGYVQQTDTHMRSTSVREALLFSAKLRQPSSTPLQEKEAYVEKVLDMCGLEAYADAIVGSLGVELKKRLTIAVELAAKPRLLLFLDEPTSGLDSQTAWAIARFLRSLADNGRAILCTIHQPSAELFDMFDRLLLLQKGGQTVYFGDLGDNARTMLSYFEEHGARSCGSHENPAEYMLDVIGAGATATSAINWHDIWKASDEEKRLAQEIVLIQSRGTQGLEEHPSTPTTSVFATSWTTQLRLLIQRELERHWRDPTYLLSKIAMNVLGGLFIGFTFFQSNDSIQGTQNKIFAVFLFTVVSVPLANQLQIKFIDARALYEARERQSRTYSWTALVTAQILAELPLNIIGQSLFFISWYWTVGFPSDRGGYTYLMVAIVFPMYYMTLGQATAAVAPSADIAALLFSFFYAFVLLFTGVLQPFRALGWWKWMYRVSPFAYLIEGIVVQAVGRQSIHCSAVEFVVLTPPSNLTCANFLGQFISLAGGYINADDAGLGAGDACRFCPSSTTDAFLEQSFNMSYAHRWRNFGLLWVYIGVNVVAIFGLTYLFRVARWSPAGLARRLTGGSA
ncbi:pleiotropic drug resistance ABC transporter [Amylostereum chailletii]|nr:pleiotropic drug resistance ABC transporter [Amylostereum chailletii]